MVLRHFQHYFSNITAGDTSHIVPMFALTTNRELDSRVSAANQVVDGVMCQFKLDLKLAEFVLFKCV